MQTTSFFKLRAILQTGLVAGTMATILPGCSTQQEELKKYETYHASTIFKAVGQDERVRFLVIHYTALNDCDSLKTLTSDKVSSHYLVQMDPAIRQGNPVILQLVDENKRAWHSGLSNWNGRSSLNDTSIGIEIVNPGYTDDMLGSRTWYPYSDTQITAVAHLAKDIIQRYQITPDNVLGHSDIAPLRKQDPGKLFPWARLAAMGVGAWPETQDVIKYLTGRSPYAPTDISVIQRLLKQYGYDQIPQNGILDEPTRKTIRAFQMHFRPDNISGNADAETEAIARALVKKYRSVREPALAKKHSG